ncbi:chemotaxis protein CheW [Pontibacter saemangeumensis]|uniref:Chemotaxis protein CheW n=1 Tax=Pontibacter saemangeumensis TaxID=1084525 RepID=A0ABP8LVQ3_9BACT
MAKQTNTENGRALPSEERKGSEPKETDLASSDEKRRGADQKPVSEEMMHLIVFKLGAESYAIKIEQVKEVTITPVITRMPRTPHFVKGVANIRGDIIAIMDLEERFHIRPEPLAEGLNPNITYTLVLEAKDYSIGVVVKEVPQSLNLPISKIDRAPSFLQDANISENFIEGLAKINERLIIVLDMNKILTQEEIEEISA